MSLLLLFSGGLLPPSIPHLHARGSSGSVHSGVPTVAGRKLMKFRPMVLAVQRPYEATLCLVYFAFYYAACVPGALRHSTY